MDSSNLIQNQLGQRWTAADQAHQVLQRHVISGALKPGDRLTEEVLATQLHVSRTPLRQALQRLVSDGWAHRSASGALYVVDVSEQEIEALYAVRAALEEMIVCQAAKHLTLTALNELRGILLLQEQASRTGDSELVSAQGERFHQTLWHLSDNQVGCAFLEDVLRRTTRYRRLSFSASHRFQEGNKQHWQILRALEKGDLDQTRRLLAKHVNDSRKYVLQAFKTSHASGKLRPDPGQRRSVRSEAVGTKTRKGARPKDASGNP